jgi:hypothetical protein
MSSSPEKEKQRSDFDVHVSKTHEIKKRRGIKDRIYGRNVINLRPNFKFRHPWVAALIVFVVVATTFLGIRTFLTRGEVKDFSATTCLGDWENPSAAQGIPETSLAASSSFSVDNSAIYNASTATEIYCGGFLPTDFSTSGTITSVTLSLVWQVGDAPYAPAPIVEVSSSTDTSSTDNTSSSSTDNSSSTISTTTIDSATIVDSSTPDDSDSSSPSSFLPIKNFFASLVSPAFAQDDSSATDEGASPSDASSDPNTATTITPPLVIPTVTSTESSEDTNTDASTESIGVPAADSSTITTTPPLTQDATSTIISTSTDASTTPTTTDDGANVIVLPTSTVAVIAPPEAPDENFLQVSYSTDGQLWIQLAKVSIESWPNLTLALPISNWTDLRNLQIKVEGIPTTQDPIPTVYLDGMVIEANYQVAPDQHQATSTVSQFLTDKTAYNNGDMINIVGAPPGSFIEIYALDAPDSPGVPANFSGIQVDNLGDTLLGASTLPAGRYIFVNTFEPGACNEYTLDECENRSDYISQIPITVSDQ